MLGLYSVYTFGPNELVLIIPKYPYDMKWDELYHGLPNTLMHWIYTVYTLYRYFIFELEFNPQTNDFEVLVIWGKRIQICPL